MPETDKDKKEDVQEEAPARKKGKGLLIIIIAAVVLAAGAGAFFMMKGKSGGKEGGHEAAPAAEAGGHGESQSGGHGGGGQHGEAKAGASGSVVNLDPFIVNLQDNSGTRYLKVTINLELAPDSQAAELTSQIAQIRDSLIILLSSKSYADIGTVEGKYQMREEIIARINHFLTKGKVKTAYFTEFVIQ